MKHFILLATYFLVLFGAALSSQAAPLHTVSLPYKDHDVTLEGKYVFDQSIEGKRPVVLVFHDWMGPSEVTDDAADKVAAAGYLAFIADIYGKGVRPQNPAEAGETASKFKNDRALMRSRAQAALAALRDVTQADISQVGAIGFCFGGTVALELARSGAALLGTVSFHGGLDTPDASLAKNIRGKILVLHGADDPFVSDQEVSAFEKEMRDAQADWQLVKFGGAAHAFTNKKVDSLHLTGAAYNPSADTRSFRYMRDFFSEIFK